MTAVLDNATSATPAAVGHSEAMIVACVLADLCGPQGINYHRLPDRVAEALDRHRHAHFLAWRDRTEIGHWSVTWDAARRAAELLYPKLPGVGQLPDVYQADFGSDPRAS